MPRTLFWTSVAVCAMIGLAHTLVGLASFEEFSPSLVWFLGAGLSMMVLALLNAAVWMRPHPVRAVRRFTHAANVVMVLFGVEAVRAVREPQAYVALAALLGLLATGIALNRQSGVAPVGEPTSGL